MSNRIFQGLVHQMRDAVGRTLGVIDETGTIVLSIHKDADEEYHSFGLSAYKTTKFDRILAYNDITLIRFFLDGKEYSYRIKWDDDMMSENLNQTSQKSRFGHLYLVISDNVWTDMKKHFPEEMINNADYEFDLIDLWED